MNILQSFTEKYPNIDPSTVTCLAYDAKLPNYFYNTIEFIVPRNFNSLEGLDEFVNLEELKLYSLGGTLISGYVKLEEFDDTYFNFTLLKKLSIIDLSGIKSDCTSIFVNGLINLKELSFNLPIINLDLKSNINIELVKIKRSRLSKLNLSQNEKLIELKLAYNSEIQNIIINPKSDINFFANFKNNLISNLTIQDLYNVHLDKSSEHRGIAALKHSCLF